MNSHTPLRKLIAVVGIATLGLPLQAQAGVTVAPESSSGSGWLEPYRHHHFSERGTPVVHTFNIEPAFTGRDVFFTQRVRLETTTTTLPEELLPEFGGGATTTTTGPWGDRSGCHSNWPGLRRSTLATRSAR